MACTKPWKPQLKTRKRNDMSKTMIGTLLDLYERKSNEAAKLNREINDLHDQLLKEVPRGESFFECKRGQLRVLKTYVRRAWVPSFWRKAFYHFTVKRA